jgi:hypothetical protein
MQYGEGNTGLAHAHLELVPQGPGVAVAAVVAGVDGLTAIHVDMCTAAQMHTHVRRCATLAPFHARARTHTHKHTNTKIHTRRHIKAGYLVYACARSRKHSCVIAVTAVDVGVDGPAKVHMRMTNALTHA